MRPPMLVASRTVADVVLAWAVFQREAPGDRLLVERVGPLRRVELTGVVPTLRARDVLHTAEVEQLAEFGRVDDDGCGELALDTVGAAHGHGTHLVTVGLDGDRSVPEEHLESTGGQPGGQ